MNKGYSSGKEAVPQRVFFYWCELLRLRKLQHSITMLKETTQMRSSFLWHGNICDVIRGMTVPVMFLLQTEIVPALNCSEQDNEPTEGVPDVFSVMGVISPDKPSKLVNGWTFVTKGRHLKKHCTSHQNNTRQRKETEKKLVFCFFLIWDHLTFELSHLPHNRCSK